MSKQLFPSGNLPKASVIAEMLTDLEQQVKEALVRGNYSNVIPNAQFRVDSDGHMSVVVLVDGGRSSAAIDQFLKGVFASMGYEDVVGKVEQAQTGLNNTRC